MNMTGTNKKRIFAVMFLLLGIALSFSFMKQTVFAQTAKTVKTENDLTSANVAVTEDSPKEEHASFKTINTAKIKNSDGIPNINFSIFLQNIWHNTGIYQMFHTPTAEEIAQAKLEEAMAEEKLSHDPFAGVKVPNWYHIIMIAVGFLIIYLGAGKDFEPLLLIPIGFGTVFVNILGAGMGEAPTGMLHIIYNAGVGNEFFPMLVFMGIGAMTDFGPLIANPKTALLGGAAQLGVFATMLGVALFNLIPGVDYNMLQACAISIIGGADGPTTIYVSGKLAPEMMAVVAVAAYSYMALVPLIQPPIMKLLTTHKERLIKMPQLRPVSKIERVMFPIMLLILTILLLPPAAPLIGMLAFGNFIKEAGCVDRLSNTAQNELMNIVSIMLSLGVGAQMTPEKIINPSSLGIIALGLIAFMIATIGGLVMAKIMNIFLPADKKINPLIGSAGVSAVPMAARVSNKVGMEFDPSNFLLMNAMGPNVSGVIGTAIAAGVFIATYG